MDLDLPPDLEEFRTRVASFIRAYAPDVEVRPGFRAPTSPEEEAELRAWKAALYKAGFLGADLPIEFGGVEDWHPVQELIVAEEVARAGLPPLGDQTVLASFALARFGTDEQKRQHLPPIRTGDHIWCQLFSEPNAGSDMAALETRARLEGEEYVIDGQKVWSTNAHWAEYGFLLARTDPTVRKHAGISAFILDMSLPGIEVRPLREITGTSDFNEVFFDSVRVPASAMLGDPGQGWSVAMESLGAERSGIGAGAARLRQMMGDLIALAEKTRFEDGTRVIDHDDVRQRLAELFERVEVCNLLVRARLSRELQDTPDVADVPLGKLVYSETNLDIAQYGVDLQSTRSLLAEGDSGVADGGRWQDEYLYARTYTIAGGSSEIMRNLLSERALGMPREPRIEGGRP